MKLINKLSLLGVAALTTFGGSAQETWNSIGTGQYRDNIVHSWMSGIKGFPQMDVEIQESATTPGRYRIMNPYKTFPYDLGGGTPADGGYIIVDASDPIHCFVEMSPTKLLLGYDQQNNVVQMAVWSIADDYGNNEYGNWIKADEEGVCGKLENGSVTFPAGSLLTTIVYAEKEIDWNMQWRISNTEGMWRMRLPNAPHLDVTIGDFNYEDNLLYHSFDMEKDVDYVLVAMVKEEYNSATPAAIAAGTVGSKKISEADNVDFPYDGDGIYTTYAIPFYNGKALDAVYRQEEVGISEEEWHKCGKVTYTEAILSSNEMTEGGYMQLDPDTYEVEIEQNVAQPGLVRLVNPYGPPYVYADDTNYDNTRNYYMEIDATDPDAVVLHRMDPIGLKFAWGRNAIWSRADKFLQMGQTKEDIRAYEETYLTPLFGKFADNKITFPENSLYWIVLDQPTQPTYWANSNGTFCIQLHENQLKDWTGVNDIKADNNMTLEVWYTLDGRRIFGTPQTPGVYICRKGSESSKVFVR